MSFENLISEIRNCNLCVTNPKGKPLPHEARPVLQVSSNAKICIAGQAPGTRVHQSGRPFTDPSGDRLRDWMGISEGDFYNPDKLAIVPMGFCFPGLDAKGGDLPPRKECRELWHDKVFEHMPQLELILVIGQYAKAYHLPDYKKASQTATVEAWRTIFEESSTPYRIPLPHPSWRNNGWIRKHVWFSEDLLPVLRREVSRLL